MTRVNGCCMIRGAHMMREAGNRSLTHKYRKSSTDSLACTGCTIVLPIFLLLECCVRLHVALSESGSCSGAKLIAAPTPSLTDSSRAAACNTTVSLSRSHSSNLSALAPLSLLSPSCSLAPLSLVLTLLSHTSLAYTTFCPISACNSQFRMQLSGFFVG